MWNRIDVANGATLHIHNESLIEDGKNAVLIRNGADYEIEYSTFNRNYYHITATYDISAPVSGVGFVKFCEFRCQTTASLPPGTPVYENLNPPHASDISLVGVYSVLPAGLDVQHCGFRNMDFGVFAFATEDVLLRNNSFKDIQEFAVYVTECGSAGGEVEITSSMIEKTPQGIFCYDNPNAILNIHGNEVHFAGISSPPQVMRGIFVDEITPASPNKLSMFENRIYDAPTGIMVRNLEGAIDLVNGTGAVYVGLNDVEHTKTQTDDQAGILVENCTELLVIDNDVTHPSGTENLWESGITVRDGNTNFLICNHSHQIGNGFRFENDQRPLTIFAKNVMKDNGRGLWLVDGIIGQQGVSGTPYDNQWVSWGSEPNIEASGPGSDGDLSPFIVRTGGGDYLPLNLTEEDFGTAVPIPSTTSGTWTNGCMFVHPNYKTEQDGSPEVENALSILTVSEGELTARDSSMRWAGQYGLYKKLLVDEEMRLADESLGGFFTQKDNGNMGRLHRALSDFNVLRTQGGNELISANAQEQLSLVSSLNSENRVEQRLAEVLNILYSNIADLKTIDGGHEARLREIAQLCPIDEGFAVHIARSALVKLDTIARLYESECERTSESAYSDWKDEPVVEVTGTNTFRAYPNPNTGQITVDYQLAEGDKGSVEVIDLLGQQLIMKQLSSENSRMVLSLNEVSSGLYVLTVRVNGTVKLSERISIMSE